MAEANQGEMGAGSSDVSIEQYGTVVGTGMERMYITKDGDTLDDVAGFFYGDSQHKQRLLDDNPELTPDMVLSPGMRIRVSEDAERGDAISST